MFTFSNPLEWRSYFRILWSRVLTTIGWKHYLFLVFFQVSSTCSREIIGMDGSIKQHDHCTKPLLQLSEINMSIDGYVARCRQSVPDIGCCFHLPTLYQNNVLILCNFNWSFTSPGLLPAAFRSFNGGRKRRLPL